MKWVIMIVGPICVGTIALVWSLMNIVTYHYIINTFQDLSSYATIVLPIAFMISVVSITGYIFYKWFETLRKANDK